MRRVLAVALCLAATTARADGDGDRAFVELTAARDTYYVGEPIRLRLRFGVDAEFFRASAVPLFQRPLDVPVQIDVPSFRGLTDTARAADGPRRSFALNDGAAEAAPVADIVRDGRAFTVCETERTLVPDCPGDIAVAGPTLRFAYATRFEETDLRGRVPLDRRDAVVSGKATTIHVAALPAAGRPPEFAGAIGRFTVSAAAGSTSALVGRPFRLTLTIEGEGNLETFDAPRLDGLTSFHVLGVLDDRARATRRVVYEIEPIRPDLRGIPEIRFAYFDTRTAQYEFAHTSRIPFEVPSPADGSPAPAAGEPDAERPAAGRLALLVVAAAVAIVAALIAARRRAAARARTDADPIRKATAALRTELADGDPSAALAAFLGACLGVPAAAVIAPDLAARLVAAGISSAAAARAAALLDSLVAARYGGGPASGDARAAVALLAAEIETALAARRGRPPA